MGKIRFGDYLKDYLEFNNISNKDFANRIGISQKHLIAILTGECEPSSKVVEGISLVTDIPIDYIYRLELNYKLESSITRYLELNKLTMTQYLNKFNYKYLIDNRWINFIDKGDKMEIIKDILKYLRVREPDNVYSIDEKIYFKSKNDKPELLLLWLEKCYRETLKQDVYSYDKKNIDILVKYIRNCANDGIFDEKELVKTFNEKGIALVIQTDIPGSKIRGAFKVHKNMPAIYLTLKHKRIADIYFALLHELAHCKTNYNMAKASNIISFDDMVSDDEIKADKQADSWLVDDDYYYTVCNNKNYDIAKEKKYPKCFVIYRLAKDGIIDYASSDYQRYNMILNL